MSTLRHSARLFLQAWAASGVLRADYNAGNGSNDSRCR